MFADEYDSGACSELYSWRVVKPRLKVASCPSASMSVASELICQHPDFQDFKENPRDRASYILWISKHKNGANELGKAPNDMACVPRLLYPTNIQNLEDP